MPEQPTLETKRLTLRPFTLADAPTVQANCDDREVASTTIALPHPYPDGLAEEWIGTHQSLFDESKQCTFAMTLRSDGELVGGIDLRLKPDHDCGEIGYLVYRPHWNHGYATEAAAAVVGYAFQTLSLNRVYAHHMAGNDSSGRVMQKIGMTHEGVQRQQIRKWGEYKDMVFYGILRQEWKTLQ